MIHVLLADDDPHIRRFVSLYLKKEGYQVIEAVDGEDAMEKLLEHKIDAAIIDIMMPKMDGWKLTEDMRAFLDTPILMISAKAEVQDRIKGFQLGIDDYMVKPFDPQELIMRVNVLLRRYKQMNLDEVTLHNILINKRKRTIISPDHQLTLGTKEFDILYYLASQPGTIFTREQIIDEVWGYDFEGDERTVDVHIKRLRQKLEIFPDLEIQTMRGIGYKVKG